MNKKTMTTVTMTPDGKTKKTIVEYNDGIKTERVFIDGVEQYNVKAEVAPAVLPTTGSIAKKEQGEYIIQTPFGPMTITKTEMDSIKDRVQKAQEEAERQAKELEAMKKAAEEQKKKLEEQKQRIKEATEKKIEEEVQALRKVREQHREKHGRFLVRFFLEGRETRIAEKRFMRAEDIYRPHLGDYVYLGNWLVEEDGVADEYWDTRFVVDDITYCMEESADDTVLIDIDVSILNDWPEDEITTYNTRW